MKIRIAAELLTIFGKLSSIIQSCANYLTRVFFAFTLCFMLLDFVCLKISQMLLLQC